MHIWRCMGSKFCVKFQRAPLKFHTKFWTHTPQSVHFTVMYFCVWVTISLNCDVISLSETGPRMTLCPQWNHNSVIPISSQWHFVHYVTISLLCRSHLNVIFRHDIAITLWYPSHLDGMYFGNTTIAAFWYPSYLSGICLCNVILPLLCPSHINGICNYNMTLTLW